MLRDPVGSDTTLTAQVAIVGSGPAGLALSLMLDYAGISTAVLEAGTTKAKVPARPEASPSIAPNRASVLDDLRAPRLGGASWTWGGRCVPYDPVDFTPRPGAEAAGWPISYAEATAAAPEAAKFLGIGKADFLAPDGALDGDSVLTVLERWCSEPRLIKRHGQAIRRSRNLSVQLDATCTGINIDANGRVATVTAKSAGGSTITVEADFFVVAAGGIDSARLLLWAFEHLPDSAKPRWLGHGYMGHLSGHVAEVSLPPRILDKLDYFPTEEGCFARRRFAFKPEASDTGDLLNIAFHIDNPAIRDPRHGSPGLSASALALSAPGLRESLLTRQLRDVLIGPPLTPTEIRGHVSNVVRSPWAAIRFGVRGFAGRRSTPVRPGVIDLRIPVPHTVKFSAEETCRFARCITLSGTLDSDGLPQTRISHQVGADEVASVLKAHELLKAHLQHLGASQFGYHAPPEERVQYLEGCHDAFHQIGLARMGKTVADSVVDPDARVHGVANLYVASSAVFPTSSQANPTFMIVCQALRLGRHLIRRIAQQT